MRVFLVKNKASAVLCLLVGLLLSVCCNKEDTLVTNDDSISYSNYQFVKAVENTLVESRIVQYWRGTLKYGLDTDQSHSYERLNIAFMTDNHLDLGDIQTNKDNVVDAIDFCNNLKVPIAAIIEGGDVATKVRGNKKDHIQDLNQFFDLVWNAKMPLLYTKGNHDLNTIRVTPDMALSDKDWGDIWFNRAEEQYHIMRKIKSNGQKSGYYYYDLNDWKVRLICVDCFDVDINKTDENGEILYWGGTSYYIANEQYNWIVQEALNFDDKEEKDWGVVVFTHAYRLADKYGTIQTPMFDAIYPKFNEMLKAFNSQSTYNEVYSFPENHFYDLSVSGDWTRYANQEKKPYLICVLSGHIHTDTYNNIEGTHFITTANQFCGNYWSDIRINRVAGTRSQNLFDILNIDLTQRKIRVIRYGAGANCFGDGGDRFLPEGISF